MIKRGTPKERKDAIENLVTHNMRLVIAIADKYNSPGLDMDDFVQEGARGLFHAASTFDVDRGFKFSTYATAWIKHYISRSIENNDSLIRVPIHVQDKKRMAQKFIDLYFAQHGKYPEPKLIASHIDVKLEEYLHLYQHNIEICSLDGPLAAIDVDEPSSLIDFVPGEDGNKTIDKHLLSLFISEGIQILKEREKQIIIHYFGLFGNSAKTLEEISSFSGVTRERIRQIKMEALKKMSESSYFQNLSFQK